MVRGDKNMFKKLIALGAIAVFGIFAIGCGKTSSNTDVVQNKQETNEAEKEQMKVTIFDVGDNSAALVQINGKNVLIGSGRKENCGRIIKYIKSEGINEIDNAILQEYNSVADGFVEFFQNFNIKEMDVPKWGDSSAIERPYREYIVNNINKSTKLSELKVGDEIGIGENAKLTVVLDKDLDSDENTKALVLRLVYGDTSVLFGGESTKSKELAHLDGIKSNVLIIPNASMVKNLNVDLVKNIDPEIGVISISLEKKGKSDMEQILKGRGAEAIYTCDGDITLISDGKTIKQK